MQIFHLFIKNAPIALLVGLGGCSMLQTAPQPCTPVEIPVVKVCDIGIPVKPDYLFDKTTSDTEVTIRVKDLMLDRVVSKNYEASLVEALTSCVGQ